MMRLEFSVGAVAIALVCSSSVQAGLYDTPSDRTVHIGRVSGHYASSFNGGEFTVKDLTNFSAVTGTTSDTAYANPEDDYQTFCVEYNEFFIPSNTYYVDVTTYATAGGVDGEDGFLGPGGAESDTLDERTAFLYYNFRSGSLAYTYSPGTGRGDSGKALQQAIWFVEGERNWGDLNSTAKSFVQSAVDATKNTSTSTTGSGKTFTATPGLPTWDGLGDVRILNMWGNAGRNYFKQDQLIMIPAPGAALLAMLGLGLIRGMKRRQAA